MALAIGRGNAIKLMVIFVAITRGKIKIIEPVLTFFNVSTITKLLNVG